MEREIKVYQQGDYEELRKWLSELGRFYDGHESGRFIDQLISKESQDEHGYFTTAKEVYMAVEGGNGLGAIVLNYKRGGSVKLGPSVVDSAYRGRGIGTELLLFAEEKARQKNMRKLYATTSHLNETANWVLIKHGFQVEAKFPDHYRRGSIEMIYGKMLTERTTIADSVRFSTEIAPDHQNVEVVPYSSEYYLGLTRLILNSMPNWHDGIDEDFVEKAVSGHNRGTDFEAKGKVILLAVNDKGEVCGCSIVVPKRGGPTKLYPVLGAEDTQKALVTVSEEVAKRMGSHKVYSFSPQRDLRQQEIFASLGFAQRGVIIEPYKAGCDLVCYDNFL